MKKILNQILPNVVDHQFKGYKIALITFKVLSIISFGRSLIHTFAADGGAYTIAGLDLSKGAENIIFAFGLWGISQLIYALIQLLVAFKYRSLIPLFYIISLLETLGRMLVGQIKEPILLHGTPPGGIANYIMIPLVLTMLILSIKTPSEQS